MSNNKDNDKSNNIQPKFNEYQAYEELRFIFVIAIETQDFSTIEARISAWEKKYPLAEFTDPEIIRKIKAILNKDFLSRLIGDYLAAKILHEQEKQKKAYDSLKEIIDTAKKTKDYKTAGKEIRKWKNDLHENGFTLYSFDRLYRARICTLLLLPSRELKNQEQATEELKKIKENGSSMNSKDYFEAISNWQNTYSISNFPEKLKKDLNQITTEVFDSISQKRTSENAILEIENVLSAKTIPHPADAIASILSKYDYRRFDLDTVSHIESLSMQAMSIQTSVLDDGLSDIDLSVLATVSPTEASALISLKDILNKTPHDMDTILNWIYVNRKIDYSEFARDEILKQFLSVGYKVPTQSSYSIPEINQSLGYQNFSEIDDIRKGVILNYLGIISLGEKLSIEEKDNLIEAHAVSANESLIEGSHKPTMFLEAFDTVIQQPEAAAKEEKLYDDNGQAVVDKDEELIYNIFIEDIIDNPLATYSIKTASTDKSPEPFTYEHAEQTILETPVIEEPEEETSIVYDVAEKAKENTQNTEDIIEEPELETATSSENGSLQYSLSIQDEENLEQAHELSTYVVVAVPLLEQVLAPKLERTQKKQKTLEIVKDK